MQTNFTKMHGLGNDVIVLDSPSGDAGGIPAQRWQQLADRHRGIGFDQAMVLEPPRSPDTLAFYRIPTGLKAWIEDVVVGAAARGHGVGEALNRAAIAEAAHRGAKNVSLTSRPSREAANRLYQRLGFQPYETNVYRYTI